MCERVHACVRGFLWNLENYLICFEKTKGEGSSVRPLSFDSRKAERATLNQFRLCVLFV